MLQWGFSSDNFPISNWGGQSTPRSPPRKLKPQHGPICHPQKVPSKYCVLKSHGRNKKEHSYPRSRDYIIDRVTLLQPSNYSSPEEKGHLLLLSVSSTMVASANVLFLVRDSIYAERAICYRPSVCPSVHHAGGSVKNG